MGGLFKRNRAGAVSKTAMTRYVIVLLTLQEVIVPAL